MCKKNILLNFSSTFICLFNIYVELDAAAYVALDLFLLIQHAQNILEEDTDEV